jgi:hypothetical protein
VEVITGEKEMACPLQSKKHRINERAGYKKNQLTSLGKPFLGGGIAPCTTRSTKGFEIEFRALLTDGAQEEVRVERVALG